MAGTTKTKKELTFDRKKRMMNEKGFKWDHNKGKFVKMSPAEIKQRTKSRKKAEKKLKTERKQIEKKIERTKSKRKSLYK